jgi:hypothetical protein
LWLFSRLLLFVVAGSYALPALHLAAVVHEVCAEHGALEHVHGEPEAVNVEPSKAPSKGAEVSVTAPSSHEHDSCGVVGISPPSGLVTGAALAAPVTLELALASALREAPANASVAILSYAPKLAPPV